MKGQISFVEFIVSFTVFSIFAAYLFFRLAGYMPGYLGEIRNERIRTEAYLISELLVNDPGEPMNWGFVPELPEDGCPAGWWNSNWQYRKALTFDNSGQSEDLDDFPILVKLDSSFDYGKTKADGTDLRFIDPVDGELKYHIEKWNSSGDSFIWVKVPNIPAGLDSDYIWMYYGNDAAGDGQNQEETYDSNFVGVWHLNESSGTIYDSTNNDNDGINNVSGRNQVKNPSFEMDKQDWGTGEGDWVIVTDEKYHGSKSSRFEDLAGTPGSETTDWVNISVTPNVPITISTYSKGEGIVVGSEDWQKALILARWLDSTGDVISGLYPDVVIGDGTGTWDWKRSSTTHLPPPGAVKYRFIPGLRDDASGTLWVDAIQIEYGSTATEFTDSPLTSGMVDGALDFDGYNDYVRVPHKNSLNVADGTNPFTIEAWIYPRDISGQGVIVEKIDYPGYIGGFQLRLRNNELTLFNTISGGWTSCDGGGSIVQDSWTHVTVVYDGACTFYLNATDDTSGSTVDSFIAHTSDMRIGSEIDDSNWFDGIIDELRISNTDRSESWIKASYLSMTDNFITHSIEEPCIGEAPDCPSDWWDSNWQKRIQLNISETAGYDRSFEPFDIWIDFPTNPINATKEVRITQCSPENSLDCTTETEIPSQVYNKTTVGGADDSANIVFETDVSSNSWRIYYVYYNYSSAPEPSYATDLAYTSENGVVEVSTTYIYAKYDKETYCGLIDFMLTSVGKDASSQYGMNENLGRGDCGSLDYDILRAGPVFVDVYRTPDPTTINRFYAYNSFVDDIIENSIITTTTNGAFPYYYVEFRYTGDIWDDWWLGDLNQPILNAAGGTTYCNGDDCDVQTVSDTMIILSETDSPSFSLYVWGWDLFNRWDQWEFYPQVDWNAELGRWWNVDESKTVKDIRRFGMDESTNRAALMPLYYKFNNPLQTSISSEEAPTGDGECDGAPTCPSDWWDSSYSYRQRIDVTNNDVTALSDYFLNFTLDTASLTGTKMLASGDDLRIVYKDGSSWIELDRDLIDFDSSNTQVLFKAYKDISALGTDSNYYMYYGNPGATNPPLNGVYSNAVGWWRFNEGECDVTIDDSLEGNDGTYNGETFNDGEFKNVTGSCGGTACPSRVNGKYGKGLEFDGIGDYVDVSSFNPHTYNEFTITAWYKSTDSSVTDDQYIFYHSGAAGVMFGPTDDGGFVDKLRFGIWWGGSYEYYGTSDIVDQTWKHLAAVRNGTHVNLYVNGMLETSDIDLDAGTPGVANGILYIGDNPGVTEQVKGIVDELRIYDRALTEAEINAEMQSSRPIERSSASWSFEEEDSANYVNDTHVWVKGKSGSALSFDGSDDHVDVGNPASLQLTGAMTVEAWIKADAYGGAIVSKQSWEPNRGFKLKLYQTPDSDIQFMIAPDGSSLYGISTEEVLPLNEWHHIVGVYEPSSYIRTYIDGVMEAENTIGVPSLQFNGQNNVRVGMRPAGAGDEPFDGVIDEVRIYNRALTDDEINASYNKFVLQEPTVSRNSEEECGGSACSGEWVIGSGGDSWEANVNFVESNTPSWTIEYTGDALPTASDPAWTLADYPANCCHWESISGGILNETVDGGTTSGTWDKVNYYISEPSLDNTVGTTQEIRVKIIDPVETSGNYSYWLRLQDGAKWIEARPARADKVQFKINDTYKFNYSMSTMDDYHVYRQIMKGDVAQFYVDGRLILNATNMRTSGSKNTQFEIYRPPDSFQALVDYVNTYTNGIYAPVGTFTSVSKDAESTCGSGSVWGRIKFKGSVLAGTKVSIYINSSADNGATDPYSGWVLVKDDAVPETYYDLLSANQERYISWQLVTETTDDSTAPIIDSVVLEASSGAAGPPPPPPPPPPSGGLPKRIGLSDIANKTNLISLGKISQLNTMCQGGGYYDVKTLLGTEQDFSLYLKTKPSGDLLLSCSPPETIYRGINISVKRFIAFTGSISSPGSGDSWTQTTVADFNADDKVNLTVVGVGDVELTPSFSTGNLTSLPIFDAGSEVNWGAISWTETKPPSLPSSDTGVLCLADGYFVEWLGSGSWKSVAEIYCDGTKSYYGIKEGDGGVTFQTPALTEERYYTLEFDEYRDIEDGDEDFSVGCGGVVYDFPDDGRDGSWEWHNVTCHFDVGVNEFNFTSTGGGSEDSVWFASFRIFAEPSDTDIVFRTRSGDTPAPDATWSGWSAPYTNPAGEAITSPSSRYVQWTADFSTDALSTPIFDSGTKCLIDWDLEDDDNVRPEEGAWYSLIYAKCGGDPTKGIYGIDYAYSDPPPDYIIIQTPDLLQEGYYTLEFDEWRGSLGQDDENFTVECGGVVYDFPDTVDTGGPTQNNRSVVCHFDLGVNEFKYTIVDEESTWFSFFRVLKPATSFDSGVLCLEGEIAGKDDGDEYAECIKDICWYTVGEGINNCGTDGFYYVHTNGILNVTTPWLSQAGDYTLTFDYYRGSGEDEPFRVECGGVIHNFPDDDLDVEEWRLKTVTCPFDAGPNEFNITSTSSGPGSVYFDSFGISATDGALFTPTLHDVTVTFPTTPTVTTGDKYGELIVQMW